MQVQSRASTGCQIVKDKFGMRKRRTIRVSNCGFFSHSKDYL